MRIHFLFAALPLVASAANSQPIEPRGVFFHHFASSSSDGTEWVHIWDAPGDRRYEFSDVQGFAPFAGTIEPNGNTTWDVGLSGAGSFSDQDTASFDLVYQGTPFTSDIWRAPGTSPEFITQLDTPETGDTAFAGQWEITIDSLDPMTGALVSTRTEEFDLTISGQTLRLTDQSGDFMQGVFETSDSVGFRVVTNTSRAGYTSFEGSSTNLRLNILADLRFESSEEFEATFLYQTRNSPGFQSQTIEHFSAVKIPTPASGLLFIPVMAYASRRKGR
jgi:hypothetical protein